MNEAQEATVGLVQVGEAIKLEGVQSFGQVAYDTYYKDAPKTEWETLNASEKAKWESVGVAAANHVNTIQDALQKHLTANPDALKGTPAENGDGPVTIQTVTAQADGTAGAGVEGGTGKPDGSAASSAEGPPKTLGEVCYRGYATQVGWIAVMNGLPLPPYDGVLPQAREGWEAAAEAVVDHITAPVSKAA